MTPEFENMTDRELAEAAVDSNNNFRRVTERALQEIDRLRESERETVDALEWLNHSFKVATRVRIPLGSPCPKMCRKSWAFQPDSTANRNTKP